MTDFKITIVSNEEGITVEVNGRGKFSDVLGAIEVAKTDLIHQHHAKEIVEAIMASLDKDDLRDLFRGGTH